MKRPGHKFDIAMKGNYLYFISQHVSFSLRVFFCLGRYQIKNQFLYHGAKHLKTQK